MSPEPRQGPGIPLSAELTRFESDALNAGAKKWNQTREAHVKWLIKAEALGLLIYSEEGAESRKLLRESESSTVHYPDSVSVSVSRADEKE